MSVQTESGEKSHFFGLVQPMCFESVRHTLFCFYKRLQTLLTTMENESYCNWRFGCLEVS